MEINKRRKIVVFLAMVLGFVQLFYYGDVKAMAKNKIVGSDDQVQYVQDTEKVDALFDERGELATDFDKNKERIAQIDAELSNLGVDFLSTSEVTQLLTKQNADKSMNIAQPLVALPTVSKIKYTSTRQVYVYQGTEYELQIIRGVPSASETQLSTGKVITSSYNNSFKAGTKNVLKVVGISVLSEMPVIGNGIGAINTFYSAFNGYMSGISETTTISNVTCSYNVSLVSNSMYVFVKYKGAKDTTQIMGYEGNKLYYNTLIATVTPVVINGTVKPNTDGKKFVGTVTAPHYSSDYAYVAAKNYYNYKKGNTSIKENYMQKAFYQEMVGTKISISIPRDNAF